MEQWKNRVAVVTGSSSGIGAQVAKDLAKHNITVAALARREELLNEVKKSLPIEYQKNFHCFQCDVTDFVKVQKTFELIEKNFGGIDILINNAGVVRPGNLVTMDRSNISEIINTNVTAITDCTRLAFKSMKERNVNGHVILINSIAGHKVLNFGSEIDVSLNFYTASKFAVTAMTETYRQEFYQLGTKVKISSVSPGLVKTEMTGNQMETNTNYLEPEDVSNAIMYILSTPPNVQVHELTIKPLGEPF
ncbi:farnesol dehydrogenase-like [Condylostylus longicornis]|uniref:farnesol dehydrogenase-like n=1 Tax=Condylostylus longicornis TaxID=2530218 RepID=UPI00244DA419|nr:farnesol dehydrogenase-like [Condylostylus longicornis]